MTSVLFIAYIIFTAGFMYQIFDNEGWLFWIMALIVGPLAFPFLFLLGTGKLLAYKINT